MPRLVLGALALLAAVTAPAVAQQPGDVERQMQELKSGQQKLEELVRRVRVREEAGERRKEAIAAVAAEAGVPKREVFDAVVAAKNAAGNRPQDGKELI